MTATLDGRVSAAVRAALRGQDPTPEQWTAITAPVSPAHLIAGAGSGKTAVMAARIVHLIERLGADPASVLGLTFTNKAAAELEQRVREALAAGAGVPAPTGDKAPADPEARVTVSTYHAFAAEVVQTYGVRVGVEPGADLLSDAQQYQILLAILESERFEHLQVRSPGFTIGAALRLASACADHMIDPRLVTQASLELAQRAEGGEDMPPWLVGNARERAELGRLVERYIAEKRRRGRIDFGDQVAKAVELVERFPEIAASLRERFPHVLLDEYQDTNVAQRRLMQRLCPPGSSVMAVGDARQAIYAFRGATMYNLLAFPSHFPGTDGPGEPLSLSTNFRSGRRILELANTVIEPIPDERRGGRPLVPLPANGEGEVRAALLADQFSEAAFVAGQIVAARRDGLATGQVPEWRDIAVLVRSKRLLGPLREALEQHDVPVEVVGLSGLLETPEVVDLVSTLRVIEDPGANVALARLLLGPRWRISPRHLYRLTKWCSRHNWALREGLKGEDPDPGDVAFALAEALDHLHEVEGLDDDARARLAAFRAELRSLRRHVDGPLLDLAQAVLARAGVWAEIEARGADRRAVSARRNLNSFLDRVAAFAPVEGEPSLRAFLAWLDAVDEAAEVVEATQPAPADSVKLMTVHQAKGLEFPMVVVAGVSAATSRDGSPTYGIFPNVRVDSPLNARGLPYELREDAQHLPRYTGNYRAFKAALTERALEDERRLFYVASTRAKQLLVLTAAWWYQGSDKRAKGPSPFWREAAAHPLVDVLAEAEEPPTSPLAERLADRRAWPPAPRRPEEAADQLFPEGWAAAVELARRDPDALPARLEPGERDAYAAALAAQQHLIGVAGTALPPMPPEAPRMLAVSSVLTYARCPRAFYWSVVRPLPGPPRPAARLGTIVHRLLERGARRLPGLVDVEPLDWQAPSTAEPGVVERAQRNFDASRFAKLPPPDPEVGIVLRSGEWLVRGRIDAVYRDGDQVELVDWKTGRETGQAAGGLDQLALYALALRELGQLPGGRVRVTYCYLGGDQPSEDTRELTSADLDATRDRLAEVLAGIEAADYEGCGSRDCPACRRRGR